MKTPVLFDVQSAQPGFTNGTTLSENQVYECLDRFKSFASCGLALWRLSYIQNQNTLTFNLTKIR